MDNNTYQKEKKLMLQVYTKIAITQQQPSLSCSLKWVPEVIVKYKNFPTNPQTQKAWASTPPKDDAFVICASHRLKHNTIFSPIVSNRNNNANQS